MIPYGLSILANNDYNSFVPGINDLIDGREINAKRRHNKHSQLRSKKLK